jgi:hypothetical protein
MKRFDCPGSSSFGFALLISATHLQGIVAIKAPAAIVAAGGQQQQCDHSE